MSEASWTICQSSLAAKFSEENMLGSSNSEAAIGIDGPVTGGQFIPEPRFDPVGK